MGFKQELENDVAEIFETEFSTRNGIVVPEDADIQLGNDAVTFNEAAVLYADMAASTQLVDQYKNWFAAEVYKSYLHCASKIIKNQDGVITAFDGDRIMAVFIGDRKCTNAAKAALQLNFSVSKIINPCIKLKFPETTFIVSHGVGIDMSKLFVARTGVRGANDLVWVGRAANYAAKLCAIREEPYKVFVTKRVYDRMNDSAKTGSENNVSMWQKKIWTFNNATIYASSWIWRV